MNELEWLNCNRPEEMLDLVLHALSARKLRLLAAAFARHVLSQVYDDDLLAATEASEAAADRMITDEALMIVHQSTASSEEEWRQIDELFMSKYDSGEPDEQGQAGNVDPDEMGEFAVAIAFRSTILSAFITSSLAGPNERNVFAGSLVQCLSEYRRLLRDRAHMLAVLDTDRVLPDSLVPRDFDMWTSIPVGSSDYHILDREDRDQDWWDAFDRVNCQSQERQLTLVEVVRKVTSLVWDRERSSQAVIVRDLCGHAAAVDKVGDEVLLWNDQTVIKIAKEIYDSRNFQKIRILYDALLDAGCDQESLLEHCRQEGPHYLGCWALDLILIKAGLIEEKAACSYPPPPRPRPAAPPRPPASPPAPQRPSPPTPVGDEIPF